MSSRRRPDVTPDDQYHVIYADILTERIDRPIGVNIYAHDGDDRSEEPVFFELRNNKPIPRNDGHTTPP